MREIFKPVLVLLIVCIVIAFSVAFVYNITKELMQNPPDGYEIELVYAN